MSAPAVAPEQAGVVVMGGGIIGLFNTLSFAKRGIPVVLIDDLVNQKRSYKVGESLLVFSNTFLRTLGGLDGHLVTEAVPKLGVWFVHGAEGKRHFDDANEWALERTLPPGMEEGFASKLLYRASVEDAQIVRPEAEDDMLRQAREHPMVTILDTARVKDVRIDREGGAHDVKWESRSTGTSGTMQARWVIDCSGRSRYLARRLGHTMEAQEVGADGFQTTAVWGQFDGISKSQFDDAWTYSFGDEGTARRNTCTLHLWGEGYWIWVINLSGGRISIGVTFDQRKPPPGGSFREQFWNVIRRYPFFDQMLREDNLLEFRSYKNVQHMTDTFVSRDRYGLVGDASTIIDAYYSQGMSHSFVASWHIANIVEKDLREGRMDGAYVDRVNVALREDWRMIRNMVRGKFSGATADGRYFLLTHLLDMLTFIGIGVPKVQITRWLVETGGSTAAEKPVHRTIRRYLSRRLFYSRCYTTLPPRVAQRLQGHLQRKLAERAHWRLENGVKVPTIKCINRFNAGPVPFWRGYGTEPGKVLDLSPAAITGTPPKFLRFNGIDRFPIPLMIAKSFMVASFVWLYAHDAASTTLAKLAHRFRRPVAIPAEGAALAGD